MSDEITHVRNLQFGGEGLIAEFQEARDKKDLKHSANDSWPTEFEISIELGEFLIATTSASGQLVYIAERQETITRVEIIGGQAYVQSWGDSPASARKALTWIKEMQPESQPKEDKVRVAFWSYSPHGPKSVTRYLDAAEWEEVESNYDGATREGLAEMMSDDFRPARGGQLLLWAGDAGTGKTHALRALARQWKDWCSIHYIVDPESFFGAHADYLTSVLVGGEDVPGGDDEPKWRLLVLEDSGELMRADAADVTGKALSRLLNTVDGLIGQGLRIMVLVTTNEEVGKLHPAIARPGRCAVEIKFEQLSREAADEWREAHDLPSGEGRTEPTIAELYAELEGFKGAKSKQPVGFVA